ncbi:MAG: hypothetical protein K2F89_08395, partial [Treponemataceae bacterium]|nr:hypothetical protein [Treponemataceae bacterium]
MMKSWLKRRQLFIMTSFRWKLAYQMPLLISLRSGIKSKKKVATFFLTFYGRMYAFVEICEENYVDWNSKICDKPKEFGSCCI